MITALYVRVSTREQTENYSIPNQIEMLKAYCKAKNWDIYDTYEDGGYSGASTDRPNLQRLLRDVKNNKVNAVIVYKLDRLSRSQRDTLDLIEDHFLKNDVDFVSVTETLDTTTPMGRAMIGIMSAFAQLERELIAERMRVGQIKRAEDGYHSSGGNYDPSGFRRVKGELITIPEEKEHIQKTFDLYEQLHSIAKVQAELKLLGYPVWRFRRYRDILSNPLYNGYVTFALKKYKGRQEKFIEDEQFNRVQKLLNRNRGRNANKAKQSLLSGLITCECCGEQYVTYTHKDRIKKGDVRYRYYMCRARRHPSEYPKKCWNKNWSAKNIEELLRKELYKLTLNKKQTVKQEKKINYNQLIKQVEQKINRLVKLYADGIVPKEALDTQIEELKTEREQLHIRQTQDEENRELIQIQNLEDYVIDLKQADFPRRQAIVNLLVKQIYIDGDNVTIEWKI